MASINKLAIRGIRAFSPDDEEQVVEFFFPCTIILGANGCGKTTIIETLKFAVTGNFPPGISKGQSFVHDPNSVGRSNVKGSIKLRFTNRAGSSMVVVRSMEVTQKKASLTFKQLDGVLRTTDGKGNRVALSHKCGELDRQIPLLLGVSQAILDHVIFCHQEDASWPLQDAATVKKKFDEIFDSSRYSKALKVLQENKKNYNNQAKDLKADVASYASHRHASNGFRKEIERHNSQLEDLEEEMSQVKTKLQEIEEEKTRLGEIMTRVEDISNQVESKRNELTQEQAVVKKQRQMLQEDFTETKSVRELQELLRGFDEEMGKQVDDLNTLEKEVSFRVREVEKLNRQGQDIDKRKARLEAEQAAHQANLKSRYEKMIQIGQTYGLESCLTQVSQSQSASQTTSQGTSFRGSSSMTMDQTIDASQDDATVMEISTEDMNEFFRHLSKKGEELKEALSDCRMRHQQQEDQLQTLLTDLVGKQKSIESKRAELNNQQSEARKEINRISSEVTPGIRVKKMDVDELQRRAEKCAKDRDNANDDPRRSEIPIEVRSLEAKIDKLTRQCDDDKQLIEILRTSSDTERDVAMLKEQCTRELEELTETINEDSYALQKNNLDHPGELPGAQGGDEDGAELNRTMESLRDKISAKYEDSSLSLSKFTDEVSQLERKISELNALLAHDQKSLATINSRTNELANSAVRNVAGVVESVKKYEQGIGMTGTQINESRPRELLDYLRSRLEEIEFESSEIPQSTIKKILSRMKRQSKATQVCPCCTRRFDEEHEFKDFLRQMAVLEAGDSPLLKLDERSKTSISHYQEWAKVVSENMDEINEYSRMAKEASELDTRIMELEGKLEKVNKDLNKALEQKEDFQRDNDEHRDLLDNAKRWAESANRIAEKRIQAIHKKEDLSMSMASGTSDGRDLRTVERDFQAKFDEKEALNAKINRLNKEMSSINERINRVTSQAANIEKQARMKEQQYNEQQRLALEKTSLSDKITQCAEEEKKLHEQLAPIQIQIRTKKTEKQRLRTLGQEEEDQANANCISFASDVSKLKDISEKVDEYIESNRQSELDELTKDALTVQEKVKKKQAEIDTMKPELDNLSKAVDDQERHKKNLEENINIIQARRKMDLIENDIKRLNESKAGIEGQDTCDEDLERVLQSREENLSKKARLEGRRSEIVEAIRGIKRKLSTPEYRDVDDQHEVAQIKFETTQALVRDIEKYHTALDKALLQYHSLKIAEINKIIRNLWSLTYKGEDITNIQIVSGQDAGSKAAKSYNYRVVMTKGSSQMDMRGRCSAGQRVLASIVIRLALAETFCVNCGCIALDEPTVNLDYNNKRGLAIALAQIVAQRSQQSNFQLIMITHDEEFVSMMKTELSAQTGFTMPEKYFHVRREEGTDGKCYSKIDEVSLDDI